ncbi:polyadenylate-binding protein RBP45-like isoform X1 [Papaver somniferum]|uniref:polyadenylate-binding protein RBP45-like isoform X1 n=2 Tax=Papaver somniferum TaxID=3469 RepID=UPI000E6FBE5A|nr:polyadenylate-binding protein RBP45-like isoform X1 [Papaver somniferum]XP_026409770.1 polyadenylate-binding protein RBP45-like isoform X1 [Papaver somniferum]
MQPATGAAHPPMAAAPAMDPQQQQQQWAMMMPAYQNQVPPPTWNQQPPPPQGAAPYMMQHQQPPQQQAYASGASQPQSADEVRTLWIGDLQQWMEETYIHGCFAHTGEVLNVKVIRNKATGQSESYGFIEFNSHAAAERVLQTYNGQLMPNVEQNFRLNWASFGSGDKRQDDSADFTVFVGDLAADVTDYALQETFKAHYTSVKGAKVVTDRTTGRSKGYGFVRFADEGEQLRAMTEMNGQFCSTRPMRIGPASNKKTVGLGQQQHPKATYQSTPGGTQNESDPNNTTIFVGGLDSNVTEENLRQVFSQFGELSHVKIPVGKRCGFVQFDNRTCAEEALLMLNGSQLGGSNIRLSWGRSPSNKQDQSGGMVQQHADPNQWPAAAGNMYGYNGGYEAYGYVSAAQDPNMYSYQGYGGPGYGNYQQHQQQ